MRLRLLTAATLTVVGLAAFPGMAAAQVIEAESLRTRADAGHRFADTRASGGYGLALRRGSAVRVALPRAAGRVAVRARGNRCGPRPRMLVRFGSRTVLARVVSAGWTDYSTVLPQGANGKLRIGFVNDRRRRGCKTALHLDRLTLSARQAPAESAPAPALGAHSAPAGNPFTGARFWADPRSNARRTADAWRATRPADAAMLERVATRAQFDWFGGWNGDVAGAVRRRVDEITAAGGLPLLVAYNIPGRDCGQHSAGGAGSAAAYNAWIRAFAAGIGARKAVVVLEPDALALADCLSSEGRAARAAMLRDAVTVLAARRSVSVYLDAGHSSWKSAAEMAARLSEAGVSAARGFATNVSNFNPLATEVPFARDLAARLGGKHALIDTSRNGRGRAGPGQWCNPAGRGLGVAPTAATADPSVDAYVWVKRVGESDGACNGGPPAGSWWPEYALGLAQRAAP